MIIKTKKRIVYRDDTLDDTNIHTIEWLAHTKSASVTKTSEEQSNFPSLEESWALDARHRETRGIIIARASCYNTASGAHTGG